MATESTQYIEQLTETIVAHRTLLAWQQNKLLQGASFQLYKNSRGELTLQMEHKQVRYYFGGDNIGDIWQAAQERMP